MSQKIKKINNPKKKKKNHNTHPHKSVDILHTFSSHFHFPIFNLSFPFNSFFNSDYLSSFFTQIQTLPLLLSSSSSSTFHLCSPFSFIVIILHRFFVYYVL
ncbi:hypothetical protein RND81_04G113800 [Saponaria officinalis]|uniref:Uncharacterized protein n=1 Tax=Saponaria officinalis TaxID=3572 RepID=A0AAW1LJQ3_SAPOF